MRALQVYRDHFAKMPGGIERHVLDLATGLPGRAGIEAVDILASARGWRREDWDGPPRAVMPVEFGRPFGISLSPGFVTALRRSKHEIAHIHCPNPTGEIAQLMSGRKRRFVATYHADLDRGSRVMPVYARLLRKVLRRCDRVIVASDELRLGSKVLRRLEAERPGSIETIPFGVDIERFSPGPTEGSQRLRERFGSAPVILFTGRLRYYKGLQFLIEGLAGAEVTLVIAGDGPERAELERLGREMLGSRFHRIDLNEDILPDVYRASDVFCLPSLSHAEAFGISVLEAMASGLPAVTTEVGTATSSVNVHGKTGVVIPPRDPGAIRQAILDLVEDARALQRMGAGARARVKELFDKETMLDRIAGVYEQVAR